MAQLSHRRPSLAGEEPDLFVHQHRRPRDRHGRVPDDPALRALRAELRQMAAQRRKHLSAADPLPLGGDRRGNRPADDLVHHRGADQEGFPAGREDRLRAVERPGRVQGRRGVSDRRLSLRQQSLLRRRPASVRARQPADRFARHRLDRADRERGDEALRLDRRGRQDFDSDQPRQIYRLPRHRRVARPAQKLAHEIVDGRADRFSDLLHRPARFPDLLGLPVGLGLFHAQARLRSGRDSGRAPGVGEAQHPRSGH